MDILIITGLSGAGKTQAGNVLEDIGYYCIDNMPPSLIPVFAEMASRLDEKKKIAVVTDMRAGGLFSGFFECLDELNRSNVNYEILFLDASNEAIARRYRETRRAHPLAALSDSPVTDAIQHERDMLSRMREAADHYIDTTQLSASQLRGMVQSMFLEDNKDSIRVTCISFGFKYGIPPESNITLDVRYLPNPFYIDELKDMTGLEKEVCDYVFSFDSAVKSFEQFSKMVGYLLPLYKNEGKSQLVISVGCTGGKHRSVAVIEKLSDYIKGLGYGAYTVHRDISKMI